MSDQYSKKEGSRDFNIPLKKPIAPKEEQIEFQN